MISYDFKYYHPSSIQEAVGLHRQCHSEGLAPQYFAGGTEIIAFARRNELFTEAVIDIKGIPECEILLHHNNWLVIGSTVTFTNIIDDGSFPLLAQVCRHVADHTNRNKITIGGHICGKIRYKEALLPLLLTDAEVVIADESGFRQVSIHEVFSKKLQLQSGDLLIQIAIDVEDTKAPYVFMKRTKQEKVDYPLVSIAAIKKDGHYRVALSGVCSYPFRSKQIEDVLNDDELSLEERAEHAIQILPDKVANNILGSSQYREFVLYQLLIDTLTSLEGERT